MKFLDYVLTSVVIILAINFAITLVFWRIRRRTRHQNEAEAREMWRRLESLPPNPLNRNRYPE